MATKKPLVNSSGDLKEIASGDTVDPSNLATGTRDGTKFLRDDGTWQAPSASVSDGDKGDIVITSGVWALEDQFKRSYNLNMYAALGSSVKGETLWGVDRITASASLSSQAMRLIPIYLPIAATLTGVKWFQQTQGNYTASNYNGFGIYTYSGGTITLVASSTDDGNIWKGTANTWQSKAFSSTYAAAAGVYYIGFLYCSSAQTTAPALGCAGILSNGVVANFDFTNSAKLSGLVSPQTTMPSSVVFSASVSFNTSPFYIGVY